MIRTFPKVRPEHSSYSRLWQQLSHVITCGSSNPANTALLTSFILGSRQDKDRMRTEVFNVKSYNNIAAAPQQVFDEVPECNWMHHPLGFITMSWRTLFCVVNATRVPVSLPMHFVLSLFVRVNRGQKRGSSQQLHDSQPCICVRTPTHT